jgi:UPF0755 protein
MTERWFEDVPEHDPDDPEAVERALRRQERAARRQGKGSGRKSAKRASAAPVAEDDSGNFNGRLSAARGRRGAGPSGGGSRRRGSGGGVKRGRLILAGATALFAVLFIWFLFALFQPFAGEGEGEPFNVNIPRGDGVGAVGDLLSEKGVISNATMFELKATLTGRRAELYHGNHQFRKNMSYSAALDELGKQPQKVTITVTVPEGLSRSETAATVEAAGLPGDYMADTKKSKVLDPDDYGANGKAKNLEGFLFPATYELKPGSTTKDLVDQQLQAFKDNIAGVNMKYAKKKNLTVYDVLTIASMIEREVAVPKERATVAAVIYNRLAMGEPLFIDATTRFAVDNWSEPLTQTELEVDSPYNTRTNQGLPPGPIGSPGVASIKAAAKPKDTDVWLYVVKPGTCGEHVFSSSLDEHNANVEKYQQAQEEAGGSPTEC